MHDRGGTVGCRRMLVDRDDDDDDPPVVVPLGNEEVDVAELMFTFC